MKLPKFLQPKTRLTLDITIPLRDKLEEMRIRIGATTTVELCRRTFAIIDFLSEEEEKGGKIIIENTDGSKERVAIIQR